MSSTPRIDPNDLRSRLRPMSGRDPHEDGRVASTLELLFDLTFVVAVAMGGSQLAEGLAHGHVATSIGAFCFTSFAIIWAWTNYSWFASAYDTDDWLYRLLTMVQMIGVVIFTLGIPDSFRSIEHGHFDCTVIVIGYVIMRVALLCQWLRAYRNDTESRIAIRAYAVTIFVAQLLWASTIWLKDVHISLGYVLAIVLAIVLVEVTGPLVAERIEGTPWHAHHIVERHGLLTIITIGEIITGTVTTLQEIVNDGERHLDWTSTVLVAVCGVAMAFGMWWSYFITPFAEILHRHRSRSFGFSYSHFLVWPSIAAVGSGLHVMAMSFEDGELHVSHEVAAMALAIPVGLFTAGLYLAHYLTTRFWATLHTLNLTATTCVLVVAILLARHGVSLPVVLAIVTFVPWITVAAFEMYHGSQHEAQILEGLHADDPADVG